MSLLDLSPDELLSTTRAVRKRLDFSKPVPDDLVRECVAHGVAGAVGREPDRHAIRGDSRPGDRRCRRRRVPAVLADLRELAGFRRQDQARHRRAACPAATGRQLGHVPVGAHGRVPGAGARLHHSRRLEGVAAAQAASALGNIMPAMWSFMLAARARGLGTAWTTIHLAMEQAVADILDIPYATMQQVCLTPLAFTKGTDFKPAIRPEPDTQSRLTNSFRSSPNIAIYKNYRKGRPRFIA